MAADLDTSQLSTCLESDLDETVSRVQLRNPPTTKTANLPLGALRLGPFPGEAFPVFYNCPSLMTICFLNTLFLSGTSSSIVLSQEDGGEDASSNDGSLGWETVCPHCQRSVFVDCTSRVLLDRVGFPASGFVENSLEQITGSRGMWLEDLDCSWSEDDDDLGISPLPTVWTKSYRVATLQKEDLVVDVFVQKQHEKVLEELRMLIQDDKDGDTRWMVLSESDFLHTGKTRVLPEIPSIPSIHWGGQYDPSTKNVRTTILLEPTETTKVEEVFHRQQLPRSATTERLWEIFTQIGCDAEAFP